MTKNHSFFACEKGMICGVLNERALQAMAANLGSESGHSDYATMNHSFFACEKGMICGVLNERVLQAMAANLGSESSLLTL